MEIRHITEAELPQIPFLYKELLHGKLLDDRLVAEMFRTIQNNANYHIIVAMEKECCVGTAMGIVCCGLDGTFLVVENVVVREECRSAGVGQKLFDELDRIAVENNCAYSILVSSDFRSGAHKFYEKMGYVDGVKGFRKLYEAE